MSKELIDGLRYLANRPPYIGAADIMLRAADALEAKAAHQRQQAREVVMPDVSAMAKVLSDRAADACNIDRTDNWAMYGQEYIDDVQAMLGVARLNKGAGSHE